MNQKDFEKVVTATIANIQTLLRVKGGEYSGSEDCLANFKRGAGRTGCTPLQVLWVYLSKHIDSVETFVRDQASKTERERSEPIDGRLDDIINYCLLAKALIEEEQSANKVAKLAGDDRFHPGRVQLEPAFTGDTGEAVFYPDVVGDKL